MMSLQSSRRTHRKKESKEVRQTFSFTPLNPLGDTPDEAVLSEDFSKPSKVHHHSKWKYRQDAVYFINPTRTQDKGLQFWQTRPHAVIACSSVPADCIYKVISQKRVKKTLDASACPEDSTQECLSITAAAAIAPAATAAARHIGDVCFREHQKTGAKRWPKYPD